MDLKSMRKCNLMFTRRRRSSAQLMHECVFDYWYQSSKRIIFHKKAAAYVLNNFIRKDSKGTRRFGAWGLSSNPPTSLNVLFVTFAHCKYLITRIPQFKIFMQNLCWKILKLIYSCMNLICNFIFKQNQPKCVTSPSTIICSNCICSTKFPSWNFIPQINNNVIKNFVVCLNFAIMTHNMRMHQTTQYSMKRTRQFSLIGLKIREMRNVFVKFDSTTFESESVCHGMIMILFSFCQRKPKLNCDTRTHF